MSEVWVVLGLGNPGDKFERTRHNSGARCVDRLAAGLGVTLKAPRAKLRPGKPPAWLGEAASDGSRVVLARPMTFMNESGRPAASLLRWFKAEPGRLIVVHDEIDLPEGALRIGFARGSGGHRGVNSIIRSIGTQEFYRVRIGVGRPPPESDKDPSDYVLEPMPRAVAERLRETEARAAEAVLHLIHSGLELTMTRFNSR